DPFAALVAKLDLRGHVLSAKSHAAFYAPSAVIRRFAGHASGFVHFSSVSGATVTLSRFDTEGALVGALRGVTLDLSGGRPSASLRQFITAGDGGAIWALWIRSWFFASTNTMVDDLVLRAFDTQGQPLTAEMVLSAEAPSGRLFVHGLAARN